MVINKYTPVGRALNRFTSPIFLKYDLLKQARTSQNMTIKELASMGDVELYDLINDLNEICKQRNIA